MPKVDQPPPHKGHLTHLEKFPAPYYGGKTHAAPYVWQALGDPAHYVEPFAGSCAVLLLRSHPCNRPYFSETVNDADGLLVNALRAIQLKPDEAAEAASWYVSEADLMARHLGILRWVKERDLEKLMADPHFCDPVIAGWWLWGMSCWIGGGWCDGSGPWSVGADGRVFKQTGSGGVSCKRPHLTTNGRGVNHAGAREPGVSRQLPHLANNGQGVNHAGTREPGVGGEPEFHPMTMPELLRWFRFLSARLRHVRVVNGDWRRVCTGGALKMLNVRQGKGVAGVFLDPPYADTAQRDSRIYRVDSESVAHGVCEWCLANGEDPAYRLVLAGFEGEHGNVLVKAGWREVEWFTKGHLRGGMGNQGKDGTQQHRERLWCSPHCAGDYRKLLGEGKIRDSATPERMEF